jgi:SAM-dependent methyltransferase
MSDPTSTGEPAGHTRINRAYWDGQAGWFAARARRFWAAEEPVWGIWNIPQSRLPVLPPEVSGLDVIELGCGTGYVSAWLARLGAWPVALDGSARQLSTAAAMQEEFGLRFPLVHGDAERVPCRDGSFDLVISEYGASVWCDPYRWVPEAARLLRPGGRLVFLRNSTLLMLCLPALMQCLPVPDTDAAAVHAEPLPAGPSAAPPGADSGDGEPHHPANMTTRTGQHGLANRRTRGEGGAVAGAVLRRDMFGLHRLGGAQGGRAGGRGADAGVGGVEFHLPHGEWFRLLRGCGFVVDDLVEVRAPQEATSDFGYVSAEWARRWPSEEVWLAHLPSAPSEH